ncbi:hypothetical protein [Brevibacillus borstelensis]|uniref:hypothetical protein n=1 Tax=Brevibacillus borstelensis TaxID=45462 RepID=UPI00203E301E|nr:hypothetical protein [Brevibacillus borstelensis]MCM3473692.1 hypothetical protein [Brevibacillus borstelensis]
MNVVSYINQPDEALFAEQLESVKTYCSEQNWRHVMNFDTLELLTKYMQFTHIVLVNNETELIESPFKRLVELVQWAAKHDVALIIKEGQIEINTHTLSEDSLLLSFPTAFEKMVAERTRTYEELKMLKTEILKSIVSKHYI